ncbi:MAG: zinc transporter, family [Thermomicrobiales bacterium]|nr:zinc transporter, family [Thermomicrobiales bacterium]
MAAETTLVPTKPTKAAEAERPGITPRSLLLALVPLLLLAGVMALIFATDAGLGDRTAPPIETLSVQRVRLPEPGLIEVSVVNDGPDPITIAQVFVDDAYWQFTQDPTGTLDRLQSTTLSIPYPWVQDEAHAIGIVSATGVVFEAEVPVAIESPRTDGKSFARFGLVGLYVGIVPVALGLLWFPFLGRLGRRGMHFVLALTIGLLLFLVVDMFQEAQEIALTAPATWNASLLVPVLAILTAGLLVVVGRSLRGRHETASPLALSYQIATGIGLHNLGEGLAIGAAFALGEAALGVFLIAGFTLHNVTEGIGIAAPLVRHRPSLGHFVALAAVAGGPAILGTWLGAFTYSPLWTTVFLAIGVGAILQVIVEVGRLIARGQERHQEPTLTWTTFGGVTAGIAVMYLTALLVTA